MTSPHTAKLDVAPAESIDSDGLPAGERLSLEEMSRIMDVAATLRKERAIVDQQLNIDEIKARLRERLLEAAQVSGDPVTENEVAAAVEQYYDRLHEFHEPPVSFATFLAHVWVRRGPILKSLAAALTALAVIWGMLVAGLLPGAARDRKLAEQRQADLNAHAANVDRLAAAIRKISSEPDVERDVAAVVASAAAARETSDMGKLDELASQLQALREALELEYTLTIINNPGERSATQRVWTDERGSRSSGFFVLVAARDPQGNAVSVPIENRETGRVERVNRWGEQIPEKVFDRLAADKQADGVLDERAFGVKRRGVRQLEVTLPDDNGVPLKRQGQITSW
jgi:hypothetical protein